MSSTCTRQADPAPNSESVSGSPGGLRPPLARRRLVFAPRSEFRAHLHPLLDHAAFVQPYRPAVGGRRDQVERNAELGIDRRGDVLSKIFVVDRPASF